MNPFNPDESSQWIRSNLQNLKFRWILHVNSSDESSQWIASNESQWILSIHWMNSQMSLPNESSSMNPRLLLLTALPNVFLPMCLHQWIFPMITLTLCKLSVNSQCKLYTLNPHSVKHLQNFQSITASSRTISKFKKQLLSTLLWFPFAFHLVSIWFPFGFSFSQREKFS